MIKNKIELKTKVIDTFVFFEHWGAILLIFSVPWSRALFHVASAIFLLGWLGSGGYGRKFKIIRLSPVSLPALVIAGIVLIWSPFSDAPWKDVYTNIQAYSKLILVLMLVVTLSDRPWTERAWMALTAGMLIVLSATYVDIFINIPGSTSTQRGLGADHSIFVEYVSQSFMTAIFIGYLIYKIASTNNARHRLTWGLLLVMSIFSVLFLLQSRSGLISVSAVILTCIFVYVPTQWKVMAVALCVSVFSALSVLSELMLNRIKLAYHEVVNYVPFSDTSLGARMDMWNLAFEQLKANPIFGTGSGTYQQLATSYFSPCSLSCLHPHNQYLFFGMEYGVLGLLAFVLLLWRIRVAGHNLPKPDKMLVYSFLSVLAIDSLANVPLWYRAQSNFCYCVMGLLMAHALRTNLSARNASA